MLQKLLRVLSGLRNLTPETIHNALDTFIDFIGQVC